MTNEMKDKIIKKFWEFLEDWDWDTWTSTSSRDKEEMVPDVIMELGLDVDIDEVYDLFYEWSEGLDEEAFQYDEEDD